jgi:pimeloyl-ACP methyl ester carboxylesterase
MCPITRGLARAIPTARVREIESAAHAVTFDAPEKFVHVISQAIASAKTRW